MLRKCEGQTGKVSLGGLLLFLPEKLFAGTDLRLAIDLPDRPLHRAVVGYPVTYKRLFPVFLPKTGPQSS